MSMQVLILKNSKEDILSDKVEEYLEDNWEIKGYSTCVKLSGDIQYSVVITKWEIDFE